MPRLGMGTWPITDRDERIRMVHAGLDAGFRHVEITQMYDTQNPSINSGGLTRIDSLHEWRQKRINNPDNPAWGWQLNHD